MSSEDPRRPDPDALLEAVKTSSRGKLKVFLGMAPGVGKTYEMLRAARKLKAEGLDVVVGIVETHGRKETQSLLRGLDVMPRAPLEYRGRTLLEFDLDGALARKPRLLLVDEYAHSNAPGSRHSKRWQDVEELLQAGIDVFTTLNVQHLESLVDVVWKITKVRQRETVPDAALSKADEIELIDITPQELRQRLSEGKVYLPETARSAADNFFKPENLTALRELALRRAAQTVDDQLMGEMKRAGVEGPWAAGERILVLIGPGAEAAALVRAGRRLSDMMMDAPWTVATVSKPHAEPPKHMGRLIEAQKLATQLGATTLSLTGEDLVETILDFARRQNMTQIVVGKSRTPFWQRLWRQSLPEALLGRCQGAALHIVTDHLSESTGQETKTVKTKAAHPLIHHLWAVGFTLLSFAGALGAEAVAGKTGEANLAMIFLLGVLVSGLSLGLGPAITAAALAAFTYNFFFLDPRLSFMIGNPADLFTFFVFFAVAMVTGWLSGRVRDQAILAQNRATAVSSLLAASRRLSATGAKLDGAKILAEQVSAALVDRCVVMLPGPDGVLSSVAFAPDASFDLSEADLGAARWSWTKGEPAGQNEGTLPSASLTFRALEGLKSRVGVIGFSLSNHPTEETIRFVHSLIEQAAVSLERADLADLAAQTEALKRSDQLRAALFNSISHDLRTPLSTVLGSATTLIDYSETLSPRVRRDLLDSIREEAERLSRYVGDLLDMTRLEGGALKPRLEMIDARDVANAAIDRVQRRLGGRKLVRDFTDRLSLIEADPTLLEQALVNILENAIAYSPDGTDITVAAFEDKASVVVAIDDAGPGIPAEELDAIFEKFRRLSDPTDRGRSKTSAKGAGLGLAIARGFVEAMNGRIKAASPILSTGGTRLAISLKKTLPTHEFLL